MVIEIVRRLRDCGDSTELELWADRIEAADMIEELAKRVDELEKKIAGIYEDMAGESM